MPNPCYNISCRSEQVTGRFAFQAPSSITILSLWAKRPILVDSRPAVRFDNDGKLIWGVFSVVCKKCGQAEWYKDGRCAVCTRESNQQWKDENREKHRKGSLRWQNENLDNHRESARRWVRKNRDKVAETRRQWRQDNPDRHIAHNHSRRANKEKNGGNYTTAEWDELCRRYDYRCLACGCSGLPLTVDHVIPLSQGGSNGIENIQPLCSRCNSSKGVRTIDYR